MTRGNAEEFVNDDVIRIAFGVKEDLTNLHDRAAIARVMTVGGNDRPRNVATGAGQLFRFAKEMKVGNRVLTYDKARRIYHVGEIVGEYFFDATKASSAGNHVRRVKWSGQIPRDALSLPARNTLGSLMTVFEPDDLVAAEIDAVLGGKPLPTVPSAAIARASDSPAEVEAEAAQELDLIRRDVESRAHELIKDKLVALSWEQMQELVAAVLRAMGYKTRVSPSGPDRGVDILASPDGLGLEQPRIKVEVKHRQATPISAPAVRSFIGGLRTDDRGLYVSTGGFTREAQYEAERSTVPLTLLDLDDLAELLVQHYDAVDADGRALVSLKRVFVPR